MVELNTLLVISNCPNLQPMGNTIVKCSNYGRESRNAVRMGVAKVTSPPSPLFTRGSGSPLQRDQERMKRREEQNMGTNVSLN